MADANTEIAAFQRELNNLADVYQYQVVNPYTRAYGKAYAGFNEALDDQARANKAMMEMALTALSLAGGALLTRVFATAALKSVAAHVSLNVICNNNLERAFKAAELLEKSPTASYIVGELWDKGQEYLAGNLRASLESNATNFAALRNFTTSPQDAATYFQDFVLNAKTKAYEVTEYLRTAGLPENAKIDALNKLKDSKFCKGPPAQVDETQAAHDIELTWWMNHLLGLDRASTYRLVEHGYSGLYRKEWVPEKAWVPITESPSSAGYPKHTVQPQYRYDARAEPRGKTATQVHYLQLPLLTHGHLRARIDTLYKARMGKKFFDRGEIGRSELLRAEMTLNMIGNANIAALQAQIKAA